MKNLVTKQRLLASIDRAFDGSWGVRFGSSVPGELDGQPRSPGSAGARLVVRSSGYAVSTEDVLPTIARILNGGATSSGGSAEAVEGRAFCFLPLPVAPGLPVHVNALFELSRCALSLGMCTHPSSFKLQAAVRRGPRCAGLQHRGQLAAAVVQWPLHHYFHWPALACLATLLHADRSTIVSPSYESRIRSLTQTRPQQVWRALCRIISPAEAIGALEGADPWTEGGSAPGAQQPAGHLGGVGSGGAGQDALGLEPAPAGGGAARLAEHRADTLSRLLYALTCGGPEGFPSTSRFDLDSCRTMLNVNLLPHNHQLQELRISARAVMQCADASESGDLILDVIMSWDAGLYWTPPDTELTGTDGFRLHPKPSTSRSAGVAWCTRNVWRNIAGLKWAKFRLLNKTTREFKGAHYFLV